MAEHGTVFGAMLQEFEGAAKILNLDKGLWQMLTHTSGMAEAPREAEAAARSLAELIPHYVSRPVRFAPGERWAYCQSGINTAARIVEFQKRFR